MRIEQSSQVYQGYQKSTAPSASSKTFGQVMAETNARDRYVPSVISRFEERQTLFLEQADYITKPTKAKLNQLLEINSRTDFTGMSSEEIYAEIWNRYNEAFDGNMVFIASTYLLNGPKELSDIHNQFYDEIYYHVCAPIEKASIAAGKASIHTPEEEEALKAAAAHEDAGKTLYSARMKVLGYEGMSFEEREAAIKEKYAGKNTALDFLKMQGELNLSGVLEHKMGEKADIYCTMLGIEVEKALNPNSIYNVGFEKASDLTPEQWYHALAQPLDTAKFAVAMKENLNRISVINGYSADIEKMMSDSIDRFVSGVVDDSLDSLLGMAKQ